VRRFTSVGCSSLFVDIAQMIPYGARADGETRGNLLVGQPFDETLEDLALAARNPLEVGLAGIGRFCLFRRGPDRVHG
jgi:hypothetical protein